MDPEATEPCWMRQSVRTLRGLTAWVWRTEQSQSHWVVSFLEPGEFDGAVLALVWGDSLDICVTFLEASSSLITCWDVRRLSSQFLPGPRRAHRSWDKRMSASGWNWEVVRKGKPDSRLGQDHCWSCRPEIRMCAPESFWLNHLWLLHHFNLFLWIYFLLPECFHFK